MTKRLSTVAGPLLVADRSLSNAWAKAVLHVVEHSGTEVSPLILSITGFDDSGIPYEDKDIRAELDRLLVTNGMLSVEDVAFTIFPERLWKIARGNRDKLFDMYRDAFPRYQAINKRANRRGLYFERLTSYGRGPCDGNQLEWILSQFNGRDGVRRSMLQASVFDPHRDHVADAQLQFPCLQHVSFEPTPSGLVANAFYATQQLFVKAYGNYLGLAQLAAFMAHEMHINLARVNVFVGVAKLERISKNDADFSAVLAAAKIAIARGESNQTASGIPNSLGAVA